jgi:hypothetical protein
MNLLLAFCLAGPAAADEAAYRNTSLNLLHGERYELRSRVEPSQTADGGVVWRFDLVPEGADAPVAEDGMALDAERTAHLADILTDAREMGRACVAEAMTFETVVAELGPQVWTSLHCEAEGRFVYVRLTVASDPDGRPYSFGGISRGRPVSLTAPMTFGDESARLDELIGALRK